MYIKIEMVAKFEEYHCGNGQGKAELRGQKKVGPRQEVTTLVHQGEIY